MIILPPTIYDYDNYSVHKQAVNFADHKLRARRVGLWLDDHTCTLMRLITNVTHTQ